MRTMPTGDVERPVVVPIAAHRSRD